MSESAPDDQNASPLDAFREQLNQMVASMQTPKASRAAAAVGKASSHELGEAALKGAKRNGC